MKCTECIYHEKRDNPKLKGICHRYPTKYSIGNPDGSILVEDYYWCGEFKAKE